MHKILTLSIVSALATLAVTYDAQLASTSDAAPIVVARRGADDPPGDVRGGRGADDPPGHVRRGRGADDGVSPSRRSVEDPVTDQRRGRGRDDATPGGRGADDPPGAPAPWPWPGRPFESRLTSTPSPHADDRTPRIAGRLSRRGCWRRCWSRRRHTRRTSSTFVRCPACLAPVSWTARRSHGAMSGSGPRATGWTPR